MSNALDVRGVKGVKQYVVKALLRMRAGDDQLDLYANQYLLTNEDRDTTPDWDAFYSLWDQRFTSDEDMAMLLSWVMGVEYEEALRWVVEY